MLGIPDFWIWSAYLLCILSTAACVIYGLYNWNKEDEPLFDISETDVKNECSEAVKV